MVWHEQFAPGSFNLPCLVRRYEGPLDVDAFRWAMSQLVRRHQPLRSTFTVMDGVACQVVAGSGAELTINDLADLAPADRDAEVARLLADATARPFDLATGPLFEPRLVRLAADDHLLVVRLHHTVFDDWSVDVFRRELSALYTAGLAGDTSPLVEPVTTFADAARRQRARLDGEPGAAERAWWRSELAGAPLSVQLPIGGPVPGPGGPPIPGGPLRLDLPPELTAELRAVAPGLRATTFMTVLAAFSVLLARSTGQDDLVIATVVAHRNRSDLEPLIGCFTKKVPLRLRVDGDPTFRQLVARTRTSLLSALAHQDVSFEAALHEGLGRAASEHGVVPQVAVVFQGETPQQVRLSLPGLTASPYEAPVEARTERHFSAARQDESTEEPHSPAWGDGLYLGTFLILSLLETDSGLALVARGTFHRPAGRRLLEQFTDLLGQIAADPDRHVSQLSLDVQPPSDQREAGDGDVLELRGFRVSRSRLEAALATCAGVSHVAVAIHTGTDGEPRLVAHVVPDGDRPPTLTELRHAQWAALPGSLWPASAVPVDALPRLPDGQLDTTALPSPAEDEHREQSPAAAALAGIWGKVRGREAAAGESYWQDFSFLQALADARASGLDIADEDVARCRTPDMLVAAMAARAAPSPTER